MEGFAEYNTKLEQVFHLWKKDYNSKFSNHSNVTAKKVRELIDIATLRESGVFFTSDALAEKAINSFNVPIADSAFVVDPTCGSGSLLVAASRKLPIMPLASETLKKWGKQLCGIDLFPEFVYCTKLRLVLESLIRGAEADKSLPELLDLLINIHTGDCLEKKEIIAEATHLALNPPYSNSRTAAKYSWANGKINNAAIYYYELSQTLKSGSSISAILPDVLRSGSRFESWRNAVEPTLTISKVSVEGRFDTKTDIDIFILNGLIDKKSSSRVEWQTSETLGTAGSPKLRDHFEIAVGAVVPYRDPHEGKLYAYIHPKILPRWGEIGKIPESRKFLGRVFQPPFVAIRRTSGPRDRHRAVPTLILGKRLVAVENHLIVLMPKCGALDRCRELLELLELLKESHVNDFLNNRIRCRHLTVSAISEIPWRFE
ncbi:N-6 DNA methylase [Pseudomonas viridiflava]|uniref:N-6 DNA methylase n=1 Tax=Pseudomonas viridiflava TaxID=33069 RepID=UPI002EB43177|nr:N-6 DNA methylase [Pseudomonas viridiflava]